MATKEQQHNCENCHWRDQDAANKELHFCVNCPPVLTVKADGGTRSDYPAVRLDWRCASWKRR